MPQEKNKTTTILLFTIIGLLVVVLGGYLYITNVANTTSGGQGETPLDRLYSDNGDSAFKAALTAEQQGEHEKAQKLYKEVADTALTPVEEANIKYRLARSTQATDPIEAVRLFKEVIATEVYPAQQKSYAAMWLPLMITRESGTDVYDAVFADEPYSLLKTGERQDDILNLYDYSLSFAPNGVADFNVAVVQAMRLADLEKNATSSDHVALQNELRSKIQDLITSGDEAIVLNRASEQNKTLVPHILKSRSDVYGVLAKMGDQQGLEMYDQAYEEAIEAGLLSKLDGLVRFSYAATAFEIEGLDSYAKTQKHIDVVVNSLDQYPGMQRYFELEQTNFYGKKERLVAMANTNPNLRNALLALGRWTEADF